MNNKTLIGLGAVAILAYYLYMRNKKPKSVLSKPIETPVETPIDRKPAENTGVALMPPPATESSASFNGEHGMLIHKKPVRIPATNLNPSIYDREVGMELAVSADGSTSQFYSNMGGRATENMQNACKCADKYKTSYKLDIPEIL